MLQTSSLTSASPVSSTTNATGTQADALIACAQGHGGKVDATALAKAVFGTADGQGAPGGTTYEAVLTELKDADPAIAGAFERASADLRQPGGQPSYEVGSFIPDPNGRMGAEVDDAAVTAMAQSVAREMAALENATPEERQVVIDKLQSLASTISNTAGMAEALAEKHPRLVGIVGKIGVVTNWISAGLGAAEVANDPKNLRAWADVAFLVGGITASSMAATAGAPVIITFGMGVAIANVPLAVVTAYDLTAALAEAAARQPDSTGLSLLDIFGLDANELKAAFSGRGHGQ